MERLRGQGEEAALIEKMENVLALLNSLSVEIDLWKTQNAYLSIAKTLYSLMKERAKKGDNEAAR